MTQLEEFFFLVAKWNNWMKLHDISVNLIYHHLKFDIIHVEFISSIQIHVDYMNEHRILSSINFKRWNDWTFMKSQYDTKIIH
jgi:hypothetical protein